MITTTAVVAGAVVLLGCGVTVFTVVHVSPLHSQSVSPAVTFVFGIQDLNSSRITCEYVVS